MGSSRGHHRIPTIMKRPKKATDTVGSNLHHPRPPRRGLKSRKLRPLNLDRNRLIVRERALT